jgi:hypothetical protein
VGGANFGGVINPNMSIPVTRVTDKLLDAYLDDLAAEPVRVVILPGRSKGNHPLLRILRGIEKGFFLAIESNRDFVVTHDSDSNRAEKYGLETLDLGASTGEKIWFPAHHNEHARPNINAIKDTVKGVNAHLILTYSAFGGSRVGLRIFLIDVKTDQVYQADIRLQGTGVWAHPDRSWYVEQATNKLLHTVSSVKDKSSASAPP